MNRRDFLTIPNEGTVKPKVVKRNLPIVSASTTGYPRDYVRHSWVLIEDAHAWLVRDALGFYAVDASCSHLGCMIVFDEDSFSCPCHNSIFTTEGTPVSGPARHSLRFLMVDLDDDGKLMIRRDRTVSADDRFIA
ncbi:MAG: Rieske 2Fe-2S domain-containing protein [Anaerolineaceae bacterium]|nr:Rieske 2Fe-2S domain-containing protein [Anaerolineaceae bacterium]